MLSEYFEKIEKKIDVRQNLSALKQAAKQEKQQFMKLAGEYLPLLLSQLQDEDAKVRKNAALLLGETGFGKVLEPLFEAYKSEKQLFVRSSYLEAMKNLDYRPYLAELKKSLKELMSQPVPEENQKHISEEIKLLRDMILTIEAPKKHKFTGMHVMSDVILVTSPGFERLTFDQLPAIIRQDAKETNGGVMVRTNYIEDLLSLRTVKGMLFRFCKNPMPSTDYREVAKTIVDAGLTDYMKARHQGDGPFYFRVDLKTKLVLEEKSKYVSRLAASIEQLSNYQLQNSISNYEFEIRITENKRGEYAVYLKMATLPDTRFRYRKYALSTSMHPVKAAEIVSLAREYMAEDAIVLDPFCGVGTLLIERSKEIRARSLYGVDIYGEAVKAGRENAKLAGTTIYFVNRDFRDFTHEYKFDEILTELPALSEKMPMEALMNLYMIFLRRIREWMNPGGHVIVLVTEEKLMQRMVSEAGYVKLQAVYHLSGKRDNALMILEYKG